MNDDQINGTGWLSHRTCTDSSCNGSCGRGHDVAPVIPEPAPVFREGNGDAA